jgi:hypothetical protein
VAKPELLIEASAVFDDVHVTPLVSVFVEPLLYWPVAVNRTEPWIEMPAVAGVTAIDVNVAVPPLETFKFAVALTPLIEAVITAVPLATPVAVPALDWPAVWTVASEVFEDVQLTELVRFCVEPSL